METYSKERKSVYKIPNDAKDNSKKNEQTAEETAAGTKGASQLLKDINAKLDLLIKAQKEEVK